MTEDQRKGLVSNVVNAVESLISAAITKAKQNDEWDDMGTYYEEKALDEALNELIAAIEVPKQ